MSKVVEAFVTTPGGDGEWVDWDDAVAKGLLPEMKPWDSFTFRIAYSDGGEYDWRSPEQVWIPKERHNDN